MNEVKGRIDLFKFIGTYDKENDEWKEDEVLDLSDFVFEIDDEGICYLETSQNFEYDPETGCLYLIMEVK